MRELALFAGGAGGILGSIIIGLDTVCAVENDPECIGTLLRRQYEGCLPVFPIWDDICTFDGRHWAGYIDIVTGGFPCTDISSAGSGEGITGENSRLFFEMLRIIEEVRPRFVFAENSPQLRTKGLGAVLAGLARLGYDAKWGVLGARDVGANHHRKRMWIVAANSDNFRKRTKPIDAEVAGSQEARRVAIGSTNASVKRTKSRDVSGRVEAEVSNAEGATIRSTQKRSFTDTYRQPLREQPRWFGGSDRKETTIFRITNWWDISRFARVDDGGADRVDFEKAIAQMEVDGMEEKPRCRNARVVMTGNMQVPAVAATAWRILTGREVTGDGRNEGV